MNMVLFGAFVEWTMLMQVARQLLPRKEEV